MHIRIALLGIALLGIVLLAAQASAQCADGSPPPCAVRRVATAATVTRPLDDRNWLVLPFENIARDQTLDVVREASVTLMYSAMSQWNDILVVDDSRVADLMRGMDASRRIGQEAAFDLARRVGAGRLVTGTLIKEGQRTRLQAAVYDVRSGQRLRSPSLATVGTDSLSAVFATLAERVLGVPAPAGAKPGESGTANTEALRAYVSGLEAERRLALDSARMFYRQAVALDSTFGLAHYHLFLTVSQLPSDEGPREITQARDAAQRFAASLPARERAQVAVLAAVARRDFKTGCGLVSQMLAKDSLDAWAWFTRSNCRFSLATDEGRRPIEVFAVDNARIGDLLEAARLDSTYYDPLRALNFLIVNPRLACASPGGITTCPDSAWYESVMLVSGDTLVHELHRPFVETREYFHRPDVVRARLQRYAWARDLFSRFLIANPAHIGAQYELATLYIGLHDYAGAERQLTAGRGVARLQGLSRQYYLNRFYLELMRRRPAMANVFADSVYGDITAGASPQPGALVGRFSLDANALYSSGPGSTPLPGTDSVIALRRQWLPIYAGVLPQDWSRVMEQHARAVAARNTSPINGEAQYRALIRQSILLSFYMTRSRPSADTANRNPLYRAQAFFALGDTARSRRALAESDSLIDARPAGSHDDGAWMFNAEQHVLLGDSAKALARYRDYMKRWPTGTDPRQVGLMDERGLGGNNPTRAYGRMWLLYADLARAAGARDEARAAYQFVVDLWAKGEAPVQPLVARARTALAQLR